MKRVFSSPDSARTGLIKSVLETAGIASEVRNEAVSQAIAGLPFSPEVWILRDADYAEARRLIDSIGTSI